MQAGAWLTLTRRSWLRAFADTTDWRGGLLLSRGSPQRVVASGHHLHERGLRSRDGESMRPVLGVDVERTTGILSGILTHGDSHIHELHAVFLKFHSPFSKIPVKFH